MQQGKEEKEVSNKKERLASQEYQDLLGIESRPLQLHAGHKADPLGNGSL